MHAGKTHRMRVRKCYSDTMMPTQVLDGDPCVDPFVLSAWSPRVSSIGGHRQRFKNYIAACNVCMLEGERATLFRQYNRWAKAPAPRCRHFQSISEHDPIFSVPVDPGTTDAGPKSLACTFKNREAERIKPTSSALPTIQARPPSNANNDAELTLHLALP